MIKVFWLVVAEFMNFLDYYTSKEYGYGDEGNPFITRIAHLHNIEDSDLGSVILGVKLALGILLVGVFVLFPTIPVEFYIGIACILGVYGMFNLVANFLQKRNIDGRISAKKCLLGIGLLLLCLIFGAFLRFFVEHFVVLCISLSCSFVLLINGVDLLKHRKEMKEALGKHLSGGDGK